MRALVLAALAAILVIPASALAQDTDEALWLAAYGQGTLGAKGRLHLEFQTRLNHDMSDLDRMIARYAVGRQITPRIVMLVGHAWIPMFQPSLRHEQRLWQQMLFTSRVNSWTIATRLRTEQRWLPEVEGISYRVRGQLRVTHPVSEGSRWSAALAEEVAVSANSREGGPQRGLDRTRLSAGVIRQIQPSLSMESGYTWEAIRRVAASYRHNHILTVSMTSRFGW